MNRGPLILTIDEAEYLLDQLPPPGPDMSPLEEKLREKLEQFLREWVCRLWNGWFVKLYPLSVIVVIKGRPTDEE
ncbi:hypothetical protein G7K_1982-t1 [Saitoella complicata NRRL Y-17804]|uniref:Uncharacterized protein n=1 Tax=Saitoella complicata (strain BCRC 22490 / CBS 7301 / JCM 7358 / NBRC 10748 / NRRL Y-17804) TaxID=698492 RepID=A0A0E9ND67_SAICN|nr:hypothetical protein G7K_1982-t1 [Saitoella complicata NRRL Y-17804]